MQLLFEVLHFGGVQFEFLEGVPVGALQFLTALFEFGDLLLTVSQLVVLQEDLFLKLFDEFVKVLVFVDLGVEFHLEPAYFFFEICNFLLFLKHFALDVAHYTLGLDGLVSEEHHLALGLVDALALELLLLLLRGILLLLVLLGHIFQFEFQVVDPLVLLLYLQILLRRDLFDQLHLIHGECALLLVLVLHLLQLFGLDFLDLMGQFEFGLTQFLIQSVNFLLLGFGALLDLVVALLLDGGLLLLQLEDLFIVFFDLFLVLSV